MAPAVVPFIKTRIAPTPSGFLHVGNIFSFALTAALAARAGAGLLLRIDDLDRQRAQPAYLDDIFETLHFLNIRWSEGPADVAGHESRYSQVHRMSLYEEVLQQLKEGNQVYACTCSRAQLQATNGGCTCIDKAIPLDAPGTSWRLLTETTTLLAVKLLNGSRTTAALPPAMQYFIVKQKNGLPAYQLTSLVDDLYFKTDLIVRGQDLWPSTLAQHYLALVLGKTQFSAIAFYHHPLLTDALGNKLSKSAGAASVQYLRSQGAQAADVFAAAGKLAGLKLPVSSAEDLLAQMIKREEGV